MSEFSSKQTRGKMVGLVFAMQGAGLVVGPLVASALLATHVSDGVIWRILLGLGAIPGLAVFYMRRQIQETPRFAMAGGAHEEAEAAIAQATGQVKAKGPVKESKVRVKQSIFGGFAVLAQNRRMLRWLIGCGVAWMVLDFAYYGNSISSPEILKLLNPQASLLHNTLVQLLIFVVFALPGYALAISLMDKTGRKTIQVLGFAMMGLSFFVIGAIPGVTAHAAPFVVLYGISYFFTEFGPNTTTFVYPAEIFPVEVRTTAHGLSAAAGKMGAFAGAYLFPTMLADWGVRGAELVAAGGCAIGLIVTVLLLPEPKGKSLEELSDNANAAPVARSRAEAA
jgi:MFS family permease